ncbi:hypothetical protein GE061_015832 [Apolygus lucorum]|uniref:Zinc finger PHD-type domain-containing protein n=1 Tax=Apolygus lucorum TaxID=248454 RepID=A0A8S9XPX6_APOLU|nr:hypothetical protein GE061_015832 [Apolygus lucorum]
MHPRLQFLEGLKKQLSRRNNTEEDIPLEEKTESNKRLDGVSALLKYYTTASTLLKLNSEALEGTVEVQELWTPPVYHEVNKNNPPDVFTLPMDQPGQSGSASSIGKEPLRTPVTNIDLAVATHDNISIASEAPESPIKCQISEGSPSSYIDSDATENDPHFEDVLDDYIDSPSSEELDEEVGKERKKQHVEREENDTKNTSPENENPQKKRRRKVANPKSWIDNIAKKKEELCIKVVKVCQENPFVFQYKTSYQAEIFEIVDTCWSKLKRRNTRASNDLSVEERKEKLKNWTVKKAYNGRIPIAENKKKDLKYLQRGPQDPANLADMAENNTVASSPTRQEVIISPEPLAAANPNPESPLIASSIQNPLPSTSGMSMFSISPLDVRPFPQAPQRKSGGKSRRRKSCILTDTPNKKQLEEEKAKREAKKKKKNPPPKARKTLFDKKKTVKSKQGKGNKQKKAFCQSSSDEEDAMCIVCTENFSASRPGESWISCIQCHMWAHEECTPGNSIYVCHHCDSPYDGESDSD